MIRWVGGLTAMVVAIGALIFSPIVLLEAHGQLTNEEWRRVSEVGQGVAGTGVLVSAVALLLVGVSVKQNSRTMAQTKVQGERSLHLSLLSLALNDASLMACWGDSFSDKSDLTAQKQRIYLNLIFSHWESLFTLGELKKPELEAMSASIFQSPQAMEFWAASRDARLATLVTKVKRFVDTIDKQFQSRQAILGARE